MLTKHQNSIEGFREIVEPKRVFMHLCCKGQGGAANGNDRTASKKTGDTA